MGADKACSKAMTYWCFVRIVQKLERRAPLLVVEKFPKISVSLLHESGGSQKSGKSVDSATPFQKCKMTMLAKGVTIPWLSKCEQQIGFHKKTCLL